MASRVSSLVRCVRVASSMPTIRPAMTMVRTMATASKKAPPPPPAPVKKAQAQIMKEEMPAEEEHDHQPLTTAEAKPALVNELKEEMKENQSVIADDQSISQEYLTEVNGTVSVEAGTKDTILTFSSNGYDIRVRWNNSEYEEPEDQGEQGQFSDNEQQEPKEEDELKTGRIPFEIDISNGKNTVRFSAESADNSCILGSMSFPDLVKEARAREAIVAGKQPEEADADSIGDEVDLAHMSDNSHDALQAFLESIKIDDQLAQFVVHHCLLQQRLAHQRVVEKFVAFAK